MTGGFNPKPYRGKGTPGRRARGKGGRNPGRNPQPGFGGGGGGGGNKGCLKKSIVGGFVLIAVFGGIVTAIGFGVAELVA